GGGTPLFGQVQPPVNGNEDKRTVQAMLVNQYVDGLIQAGGDIIVLGDVNEFEFNEPSTVLAGSILQNLTFQLAPPERYTFIFGGNSQALDHIYVSNSLASQVEYDIVHTEVEFANAATDHEPLLARVSLVGDSDSDGIADDADNCIEQANPDQYDANNDGIGNICDADFAGPGNDGDCLVNFLDLTAMKLAFFSNPASPGWDPAIDLDNSGLINFVDLNLLKNQFFGPPGPSALPNDCAL
ncbi:MAG: hypothetical protein KJO55_10185, partial [Gammaproteobacteria bacterium]|nr:hypothetical protein [Gammaproteobacteria bacterium]